jgi:hypothetical protein
VTFTKVLTIYCSLIHPLHLLYLPSPISEIISAGLIFFHLHTCVHNISTIFTFLYLFPYSPPLTDTNHPDRTYFTFLICVFEKKMTFLFVWNSSIWCFILTYIHCILRMYYNLSWFIPSSPLLSTLLPFLWWFQQV